MNRKKLLEDISDIKKLSSTIVVELGKDVILKEAPAIAIEALVTSGYHVRITKEGAVIT